MCPDMKYWFVFIDSQLVVLPQADGSCIVPFSETPPRQLLPKRLPLQVASSDKTEMWTYETEMPEGGLPDELEAVELRSTFGRLSAEMFAKAGKCREMLYWDSNTIYCGKCGGKMKLHTENSKCCTACGTEVWPQLATAVICLIEKGDEILLVRTHQFRKDYYGLVAGFVETGEKLEDAVRREAAEETGIRIKNIRYFGSQPWPYPCGLMVGYTAEYDGGDIRLQTSELADGRWFRASELPRIPDKASIARRLIDCWLEKQGVK